MLTDYMRLKKFIAICLIFYFAAGLTVRALPNQEIFPFFSWFLFPLVPNVKHKFMVQITSYRNESVNPPKFYNEAIGIVKDPHSVVADSLIGYMATYYVKRSDEEEGDKLRALFEKNFLDSDTQYALVGVKYDPFIRWKTGNVIGVKTYRTFNTNDDN